MERVSYLPLEWKVSAPDLIDKFSVVIFTYSKCLSISAFIPTPDFFIYSVPISLYILFFFIYASDFLS